MSGYVGGRIRRIKVLNFMTYDNVEIYPKKGLNLIVGLNGSGKSSIMCAICLGLAGKPNFTGRASQLTDFIKHGCQEAEIEIELESDNFRSIVINRKLKGDKCEWTLENKPSNQNEVATTVKKFNIDTSNLCQFLPQEKVVEFSKMDKKQRLENMLQAIGEPRLFQLFNELKELNKKVIEVEQTFKKHQTNKNAAEAENQRISDEVQKQESRVRLKKELEELYKKKKILIYKDIYEETKVLKEKEIKLITELKDLNKERDEALAIEETILNEYRNHHNRYQEYDSHQKNVHQKIIGNSSALISFKEQVECATIEYKNKLAEKEAQQKRLQDVSKQIEALEGHLHAEVDKYNEYNREEQVKSQALSQLQLEISDLYQSLEKASAEKNTVDYALLQLKNQMNVLGDEQNKKMANLKRRDKFTYEAACWLLENRSRFKANVYLPIMIEINMKSSEDSKYVENVIGFRDMIAFVCEDKEDCERLSDILKKQKNLPVNIVMAPDTAMSNYPSPALVKQHRECGLECFIIDLFTAPEPVMRYLCACYAVHRIPVGKKAVNRNKIEYIVQTFQVFFAENMRITGKRSRYGNRNWSVKQDFIMTQNLLIHTDDDRFRQIQLKCMNLEKECEQRCRILEEFKVQLAEKEKSQEKLRQEKKDLQDKKRNIDKLKSNYLQKKQYQSQISINVINEVEESEKVTRKVQAINESRERVLSELEGMLKDFVQLKREITKIILKMNYCSKNLKFSRDSNEDIHEKVKTAMTVLENLKKEAREKRHCGRRILAEIKEMGGKDGELEASMQPISDDTSGDNDSDSELEEEYLKFVDGPNPVPIDETMDDVEQKINHIQAELNLNEDNEPLVNEFNTRKRKIESIQSQIDVIFCDLNELKSTIKEKKKEWLKPLQRHIDNINRKFSHYFKELSCAGEISLDIPENQDDFTKYGLRINLKFHDEEASLTELSQTHHSGGECSVAAIVFILSLQELTEVPFRCIDEINQGMDSINERKIYQLIADSVEDDKCSQYFLLTPKLLMDLEYPKDVAVHVIFNSPYLHTNLNVKKHLEIVRSS